MKIVQIGAAGHAVITYPSIRKNGFDFVAVSPGLHGEDENTGEAWEELKKSWECIRLYADYKQMIEREKPDIVLVNSWFNDNGAIALYCLEQGCHVFCEKPMATGVQLLKKLTDTAEERKLVLSSMFEFRYHSEFAAAKKAVAEGKIGKIRLMDARKSYKLGERPIYYQSREFYCGIIPWVAIHAIDLMSFISGEKYTAVRAFHSCDDNGNYGDMDIIATAQFTMSNGALASVTADMYRPSTAKTHGDDRIRIVGTMGIIEVMNGKTVLISNESEEEIQLPLAPAKNIFDDFTDRIKGIDNDLTPESVFESTYWALEADRVARENGN